MHLPIDMIQEKALHCIHVDRIELIYTFKLIWNTQLFELNTLSNDLNQKSFRQVIFCVSTQVPLSHASQMVDQAVSGCGH